MTAASQHILAARSESDTLALAERIGSLIDAPVVIGLSGDLGAGKTVFVRGLCAGLGLPPAVRVVSPSFKLLNVYSGGRFVVYHIDAWRLTGAESFLDLDVFDMSRDGVLAVEWPENVNLETLVDAGRLIRFELRATSENGRDINRLDSLPIARF